MRRPYQFALLRFVLNHSSGEFVNVGVVLWMVDSRQLRFRINDRYGRISRFFSEGFSGVAYRRNTGALRAHFAEVAQSFESEGRVGLFSRPPTGLADVLTVLLPHASGAFQWSSVMAGVHAEPEQRLDVLFHEFVERHESRIERPRRIEAAIWADVERDLRSRSFTERGLRFGVPVESRDYSYTFHAGWVNGLQQFVEPIGFDLAAPTDIVEKAVKWRGRLLTLASDVDFRCTAVVAPPAEPDAQDAFERAVRILSETRVVRAVVPESRFAQVVPPLIEQDLEAHAEPN